MSDKRIKWLGHDDREGFFYREDGTHAFSVETECMLCGDESHRCACIPKHIEEHPHDDTMPLAQADCPIAEHRAIALGEVHE